MKLADAQQLLAETIAPLPYDRFFNDILGKKPIAVSGAKAPERAKIAGDDPKAAILAGFDKYAAELTCHIRNATTPPPMPRNVPGPDGFLELIREYQAKDYTVRIPEVTDLSPALTRLTRALEVLTEAKVGVVIFWSDGGAEAPIHHDEVDVIVIQLLGTKKWFISNNQPTLTNKWKELGEKEPELGPYATYDVKPGDLIYLPRGTPHTVQSTSESIHLAIGFVPVTVRETVSAALDYLSDADRSLRETLGMRADDLACGRNTDKVLADIRAAVEKLHRHCQSDDFLKDVLAFRRARMMLDEMDKLPKGD